MIILKLPAKHHDLDSLCLTTKFNFLEVPCVKKRHTLPKGNTSTELSAFQLQ